MRRSNLKNTGKPFEARMETVLTQYSSRGILRMKKVDPPIKIIGKKVILLDNPFLDFVGVWGESGGRAVFCECKSTTEPRLYVPDNGGLTSRQVNSLYSWHNSGAVCFALWEYAGDVFFVTIRQISDKIKSGAKHFKPGELARVEQGMGFILFDFVRNMRQEWPVTKPPDQAICCKTE